MAQTPEGKVKSWLYGSTAKPGVLFTYFPGAYVYKPPGGMFGQSGAPDCFLVWRGVFVAIEVKRDGGEATDLQLNRLRKIIAAGGIGAVLQGKDTSKLAAIKAAVMAKVERRES
jgi:hypothetical protein